MPAAAVPTAAFTAAGFTFTAFVFPDFVSIVAGSLKVTVVAAFTKTWVRGVSC